MYFDWVKSSTVVRISNRCEISNHREESECRDLRVINRDTSCYRFISHIPARSFLSWSFSRCGYVLRLLRGKNFRRQAQDFRFTRSTATSIFLKISVSRNKQPSCKSRSLLARSRVLIQSNMHRHIGYVLIYTASKIFLIVHVTYSI